ncbi:MAG: GIY-YIG nuclease family protein [Candidatus Riesia sp.]|nr:GIY-YIG nuclease family protein [Candidatus Riesia sp.]
MRIIGIYKITSPTNRVYIGQSSDIKRRQSEYKYLNNGVKSQPKLFRSINKYGWDNHTFEIIEECLFEDLNKRERYWQEYYNVLEGGLNCCLVETKLKNKQYTEEVKEKMRIKALGRSHTDKTKRKLSNIFSGEGNPNWNKKPSKETIEKIKEGNRNKTLSQETKNRISKAKIGTKCSEETRNKMSESHKGKTVKKIDKLDLQGNYICTYNSITEAAKDCGGSKSHISCVATGRRSSTLGYKWKYTTTNKNKK